MKIVDKLIGLTKRCFQNRISDNRRRNSSFAMPDILQGALAMFHLKDPSLLIFRQNMVERAENLRKLYKINALPEDSALREALDVVDWRELHQTFSYLWTCLLHKKDLSERRVLGEYLAFAADGTAHFASAKC